MIVLPAHTAEVIVVQDWRWKEGHWLPAIVGVAANENVALGIVLRMIRAWNLARPPLQRLLLPLRAVDAIRLYQRTSGHRIGFVRTHYESAALDRDPKVQTAEISADEFDEAPGETIESLEFPGQAG